MTTHELSGLLLSKPNVPVHVLKDKSEIYETWHEYEEFHEDEIELWKDGDG